MVKPGRYCRWNHPLIMKIHSEKRQRAQTEVWADSSSDISSLIDVSFLLIIYFLVVTSLQPKEVEIGLALPIPGCDLDPSPWRPMQVRLQEDGSVLVGGGDSLSSVGKMAADGGWSELSDRLETYRQASVAIGGTAMVRLEAANDAPHASLIGVLNATHAARIDEVLMQK